MQDIYLLLGSNLGDRDQHLKDAMVLLADRVGEILKYSSVYETASWGKTDQPEYLNQVIHLKTNIEPTCLMEKILAIEQALGRKREEKWGSRIIDIDILFYGDQVIDEPGLVIPHPYLHVRRFTLAPLAEIMPDFNHPVLDRTINDLYCSLKDKLEVKKIKK